MESIKYVIAFLIVCGVLLFGVQHYKGKSEKLQHQLTTLQAKSVQVAHDKQVEVDKTHERANEYLRKARQEHDQKVAALNARIKSDSVSKRTKANTTTGNGVSYFQEPARVLETRIEYKEKATKDVTCEMRYKELWETWSGLCLIYGCTD